jgi:hypothetical protein
MVTVLFHNTRKKGLESILESERIKKEILDFEQDLWNR